MNGIRQTSEILNPIPLRHLQWALPTDVHTPEQLWLNFDIERAIASCIVRWLDRPDNAHWWQRIQATYCEFLLSTMDEWTAWCETFRELSRAMEAPVWLAGQRHDWPLWIKAMEMVGQYQIHMAWPWEIGA